MTTSNTLPPPTRPPGEPKLSHSGKEQPEQTGLLMGSTSGGAKHGSRGFGDEVSEGLGPWGEGATAGGRAAVGPG